MPELTIIGISLCPPGETLDELVARSIGEDPIGATTGGFAGTPPAGTLWTRRSANMDKCLVLLDKCRAWSVSSHPHSIVERAYAATLDGHTAYGNMPSLAICRAWLLKCHVGTPAV